MNGELYAYNIVIWTFWSQHCITYEKDTEHLITGKFQGSRTDEWNISKNH